MAKDDAAALAAVVRDHALPAVEDLGAELVDVEVKGQRGRRIVRVVVDGDEGIDVDVVADVSRRVSEALDADDELFVGAYTLEVTSPGVDRPLTEPRHFRRNVGRQVRVLHRKGDGTVETEGKLHDADDDAITVNVKGRMATIPLDAIEQAKVVLPW